MTMLVCTVWLQPIGQLCVDAPPRYLALDPDLGFSAVDHLTP